MDLFPAGDSEDRLDDFNEVEFAIDPWNSESHISCSYVMSEIVSVIANKEKGTVHRVYKEKLHGS